MTPFLFALLSCAAPRAAAAAPAHELDQVVVLELGADGPVLGQGEPAGPTAGLEYTPAFSGNLYVWVESRLDTFAWAAREATGEVIDVSDDSGGGTTPWLEVPVAPGEPILVGVGAYEAEEGAGLELHLVAAPETAATLAAVRDGAEALAEARRLRAEGDEARAGELLVSTVRRLVATEGGAHSEGVQQLLWELCVTAGELELLEPCAPAISSQRAYFERTRPASNGERLGALYNLGIFQSLAGEDREGRALAAAAWAGLDRTEPEEGSGRLEIVRMLANLAVASWNADDLVVAREQFETVLMWRERLLPPDHPDTTATRQDLAEVLRDLGALPAARDHLEQVVAAFERTLPPDHEDLLDARRTLADVLWRMGELTGARVLQEELLATRLRLAPEDDLGVASIRSSLAATLYSLGDRPGARALYESVVEARERRLPAGHPDVTQARANLAVLLLTMRELDEARALQEAVLEEYERTLPPDDDDLLLARGNLAMTLVAQEDLAGARELQEAVLAGYERTSPPHDRDRLRAQQNLAHTLYLLGEWEAARDLQEPTLALRERTLPEDHRDLLRVRDNLCRTVLQLGDDAEVRRLARAQLAGIRARVLGALALAPRQAREVVGDEAHRSQRLLFAAETVAPELREQAFELRETMRAVAGEAERVLRAGDAPDVRALMEEARSVRAALADLAAGSGPERGEEAFTRELAALLERRDRLERQAGGLLAERGAALRPIELRALADALPADAAAVAYSRVAHWERNDPEGELTLLPSHLVAHVVLPDATLAQVDLGEAWELEELATTWRAALGAPLLRGVAPGSDAEGSEEAAGAALRARLLDPVLGALGEGTRRLYACADDLVFLVPLDALPLDEGRVGDRWRVSNEVSFARLVAPAADAPAGAGLLAVGGVDYDAGTAETPEDGPGQAGASRAALPDTFTRLLQTRFEARTTAELCEVLLGVEPVLVTGADATKAALFELAPARRYLHLATHGWFAGDALAPTPAEPDEVRGAEAGSAWARMDADERVTGMAPMLLCGLALAGANSPVDALGRRPGILTAEELCSLDLRACELAVLSACETNVGIRRAGQGIQSLQAALYAAGARSSITSLWKVDDAATRRLFELFYTYLWEDGLPKAEALWKAKRALRDDGAPVRDWAAWVLTGDPD